MKINLPTQKLVNAKNKVLDFADMLHQEATVFWEELKEEIEVKAYEIKSKQKAKED
jgi:hypothetical protein